MDFVLFELEITNGNLYVETKIEPWSIKIKGRRLSWLCHKLRFPVNTPTEISQKEALIPTKRSKGRPPMSWLSTIKRDLIN